MRYQAIDKFTTRVPPANPHGSYGSPWHLPHLGDAPRFHNLIYPAYGPQRATFIKFNRVPLLERRVCLRHLVESIHVAAVLAALCGVPRNQLETNLISIHSSCNLTGQTISLAKL